MTSNIAKIFSGLLIVLLLAGSASGFVIHKQNCKQQLREVDRYALPYIVEFMQVLSTWKFDSIEPYLTQKFAESLSPQEWQKELDDLSVLGDLISIGRPYFISHKPYKRYYMLDAAVDFYSVRSTFYYDNAVVRLHFVNHCGTLQVTSLNVTSDLLRPKPVYSQDTDNEEEELQGDELLDLDVLDEEFAGDDFEVPEEVEEQKPSDTGHETKIKKKPKGKIYRY